MCNEVKSFVVGLGHCRVEASYINNVEHMLRFFNKDSLVSVVRVINIIKKEEEKV